MADEPNATDVAKTPETQPDNSAPDTPRKSDPDQSGSDKKAETFSREYVEELRQENATRRKEAKALEKRLADIETSSKAAEEKKLLDEKQHETLAQKAMKERDEALAKVQETELKVLRLSIAADFKLSPSQAKRLQGSTEEELRKDAEDMVAEFGLNKPSEPAAATPQTQAGRQTQTTIAPDGRPVGETDEQIRARIYKPGAQNSPLFKSQE